MFLGILWISKGKHLCQSLLMKLEVGCSFPRNLVKFLETPILKNRSNGRDWREISEANLTCLLCIKMFTSSLKMFSKHLKAAKLYQNEKKSWLNQKKREIRKRKATKPMWKKILSLIKTCSESELLSDSDLLTWFVFWVYILKS